MRILAHMGLRCPPNLTYSLSARQVFGAVAREKFSVDIDNRAINSTLDQFYLFSSSHFLINSFYFYFWFTCSSLLHMCCDLVSFLSCDFKKVFRVYAKTRA